MNTPKEQRYVPKVIALVIVSLVVTWLTTALSFYSLRRLERGEIQPTEEFLASRVAYFYLSYGPADHPRKQLDDTGLGLLQAIHDFSQTNDVLQAALKKRAEDFLK
jgi:hypothetical protein